MLTRGVWRMAAGLAVVGALFVGQAMAQPVGGPAGGGSDDGGGGRRAWRMDANVVRMWSDPNYMRKMMSDNMRKSVGATEEEWTVLEPKVEKVQRLSAEVRGGGMMMGGGGYYAMGMGGRGGEESDVMKASQALRKVLADKDAAPGDIKSALQALRDARAKAKAALEEAQKELRSVLTLRQEAQLVQMGLLD